MSDGGDSVAAGRGELGPGGGPAPPPSPAGDAPLSGRLHPAVLVLWPLSQAGPLVLLLIAGSLEPAFAVVVVAMSAAMAVTRYARFRWRVERDALVIEQGLFQRRRRVIPLDRVQSVNFVRKLRHRLLGVVELRVEAVGGDSAEGRIDALSDSDAEGLRATLLRTRGAARARSPETARAPGADAAKVTADAQDHHPAESRPVTPADGGDHHPAESRPVTRADGGDHHPAESRPVTPVGGRSGEAELVRLRPATLVVAGLTGGRVGVAAALLGFADRLLGDRLGSLLERLPGIVGGTRGLLALALAVAVAAFAASVVATAVVYWNFTVVRDGAALRISRGLLERRQDTLPLRRIQALRVEENLLRRLLGLASVKVDVAGRSGREGDREAGLLLPLGSRAEALSLVDGLLGAAGVSAAPLASMPARARTRRLVRAGLATAAAAAAGAAATQAGGPVALAWAVGAAAAVGLLATGAALLSYDALGHGARGGVTVARAGLVVRRTAFVPNSRLQSLALTASPWQRRRRLASLELQIARSPGPWSGPRLLDLDAAEARSLLRAFAAAVSRPST